MNRFFPLLGLCLFTQACVYVPPVWDAFDANQSIERIEPGVTTRKEVLSVLGNPDNDVNSTHYLYTGHNSAGIFVFLLPTQNLFYEDTVGGRSWSVEVFFDESSFVEAVIPSPRPQYKPGLVKRAKQGDAQAQYELTRWSLGRWTLGKKKWQWLCLAANQGHAGAQYQIGRRFETARNPDHLTAFMWYNAAATGELPAAPNAVERVSQFLTPELKTKAERLVAEWQPNLEDCEVEDR